MAQQFGREAVSDPLARNPRERAPERSLQTYGVRNPGQTAGNAASKMAQGRLGIIDGLQAALGEAFDSRVDEWVTEGKLAQMSGVTEDEIIKSGNKYTQQGWQAMQSADLASQWAVSEQEFIINEGHKLSPEQYNKHLMESRKRYLENLPEDPAVRKVYAASFDQFGPRLSEAQTKSHNEFNRSQSINGLSSMLFNGAGVYPDASQPVRTGLGDTGYRVSSDMVAPVKMVNERDRDIGIRTMLGEAGGEGSQGMAAVAHVLKNRSADPRWKGRISEVALQESQFSTWNKGAGGNNPDRYDMNSEAYKKAGEIFDAVMGGYHIDPTGGATHYYSPAGMDALVAEGSQSNTVPRWLQQEQAKSGGRSVKIGGHIFVGKADGISDMNRQQQGPLPDASIQLPQDGSGTPEQVAAAEGIPTQTKRGKAQIMAMIENSPGTPTDKATAVADAMRRSLDSGDDTLFNDAGGIDVLHGLGAKPSEIDEVLKAKERFDNKAESEYNGNWERDRAATMRRVEAGEFATADEAIAEFESMFSKYHVSASESKSLAREVAEKQAKAGSDIIPLALRDKAADLHTKVQRGLLTPNEAGEQILEYAKANKIKDSVANNFINDMYATDQARKNEAITAARAEMKKQEEEKQVITSVQSAINRGFGLKGLKGNVRIPDEDSPGKTREVSAEEYGIYTLKNQVSERYAKMVARDGLDPAAASVQMRNEVYESLAKQGVYDVKFGQQLAASVTGDIVKKDGTIYEGAIQAVEFYKQMKDNKKVGGAYLAGMIPKEARDFLDTVYEAYDGRLDLDQALLTANQRMQDPNFDKLDATDKFYAGVKDRARNVVASVLGQDSWWNALTGTTFNSRDATKIFENNPVIQSEIERRAQSNHMRNPRLSTDVATKQAGEDVAKDSVLVGNSVIIGSGAAGKRLDQQMNLEDVGKDAPDKAFEEYLKVYGQQLFTRTDQKTGKQVPVLDSLFEGMVPTVGGQGVGTLGYPVEFYFNEAQGSMQIILYDGPDKKQERAVADVDVRQVGDWYKKRVREGQTQSWLGKAFYNVKARLAGNPVPTITTLDQANDLANSMQ